MFADQDVRFWRDPDLYGLEIRYSRYRTVVFPRHAHESYSIGAVLKGETYLWARGCDRSVNEGDVALFEPGEVHACNPACEDWSYYMFHVRPDWLEGLLRDLVHAPEATSCKVYFPDCAVHDAELVGLLEHLAILVAEGAEVLERQGSAIEVFGLLLSRYAKMKSAPLAPVSDVAGADRAVHMARKILASNLADKLTLEDIACQAAMSPYHLLRIFRDATGVTPHAWRTQRRISHARELLAGGMPFAEAALATGFTDQSHFSKVFKQYVGATPSQYRNFRS